MKKSVITIIVVLLGLLLGSFIGELVSDVSWLNWLNYGNTVGIKNFDVDLYTVSFNLGLTFKCTISSMIGLILSLIIYFRFIK